MPQAVHFDTHPEWSNFPAIRFHDSNDNPLLSGTGVGFDNTQWRQARDWWRPNVGVAPVTEEEFIFPRLHSAGACRTYPPRILKLRYDTDPAVPEHWAALVPCSHVVAPPSVVEEAGAGPGGGSSVMGLYSEATPAAFRPDQMWIDHFDHGFLQVFDIQDPWSIVEDSRRTISNGGVTETIFAPHRTDLDVLFLSQPGGAAFRVETAAFEIGGETRTFAFVAEFNGAIEVFDITDILYVQSPSGYRTPIHRWEAPLSVFDSIPNNVRAIAVDRIANNQAMVYVGVSRMGIMSIPYDPTSTAGFVDAQRHLVKTPGEVWGLEIRDLEIRDGEPIAVQDPSKRTLICADSYGGNRVYSLRYIDDHAQSGTSAPAPGQ